VERQIAGIIDDNKADKEKYLIEGQPTIFHELINSNLPPIEKSLDRLWQEGQIVVGAGADTTANALTITTFHVLDNPEILKKLRKELLTAMPERHSRPRLVDLEHLPYLVSCSHRLYRAVPLTFNSLQ
jgi:cytochrome P450